MAITRKHNLGSLQALTDRLPQEQATVFRTLITAIQEEFDYVESRISTGLAALVGEPNVLTNVPISGKTVTLTQSYPNGFLVVVARCFKGSVDVGYSLSQTATTFNITPMDDGCTVQYVVIAR